MSHKRRVAYNELERQLLGEFGHESEQIEHVKESGQNECNHRDELDPTTAERYELVPDSRTNKRHQTEHLNTTRVYNSVQHSVHRSRYRLQIIHRQDLLLLVVVAKVTDCEGHWKSLAHLKNYLRMLMQWQS